MYKIGISFIFDPKRRNIVISKGKKKKFRIRTKIKKRCALERERERERKTLKAFNL